jgi:hypothetical protein
MNLKQMSCKNGMSMEMPMAMAGIRRITLLQGGHKRLIPGQWAKQSSILSPQCIMWHSLTVLCDVKQPNVNSAKLCMIITGGECREECWRWIWRGSIHGVSFCGPSIISSL